MTMIMVIPSAQIKALDLRHGVRRANPRFLPNLAPPGFVPLPHWITEFTLRDTAMNAALLQTKFARIGARAQLLDMRNPALRRGLSVTLDVQNDAAGEYFDIRLHPRQRIEVDVLDLRRREQHLLLRARDSMGDHLFLCGHDERHWFVAGIPEAARSVANVFAAMEALKPTEVVEAQRRQGLKGKELLRRKNAAFIRQGEWFFLPAPTLHVDKKLVLWNEPLSRGNGSKPHQCEYLYRKGGESVYVCDQHPQGLTGPQQSELIRHKPRARNWNWRHMQRNPEAYAKGKVSHPDHKTIELFVWHKVLMNTEGQSQAMSHVVFLD
jgi:hypothetical protein